MDYREADERVFDIMQTDGTQMFSAAGATAFPNSYRAMFGFCMKANLLKTALFDMVDSENPYAFKVLFRCLCEHHLKFMYVWVRFLKEKSDAVGTEYFTYCGASELREYAAALVLSESLLGRSVVANVQKVLAKGYAATATMSVKDLKRGAAQFRYRAILRFLSGEMPGAFASERPFLARIVTAYAELSSFVHGGPACDGEMRAFGLPQAIEDCHENASVAFMMCASMLMFTAMGVSREFPKYGVVAGKVKTVLDEFHNDPKPKQSEQASSDDDASDIFLMPTSSGSRPSMSVIFRDPVHDERWFSARMTNIQFQAMAVRLERNAVIRETRALLKRRTISAGRNAIKLT